MGVFNKITTTFQGSRQFLRKSLEEYIIFNPEAKHLVLKSKTVLLLCQQAESRVEQLKSLKPDVDEGLIATIEYNKIQVKLHFTPEKFTLKEDSIEGELRLLKQPQFETESIVYRYLIAGWKTFLGGRIPDGVLPKEVRIEDNKIYYTLPQNQLQVLDALLHNIESGSVLMTNLKQGSLTIEASVAPSWNNIQIANLIQVLISK
ncbi:hypothetical protein NIES23_62510 (plasmid) [Trichormus variabilis NIES-23]|uniref:Uncharacterized protein n=1 Tax=Trichormus variabilis NIES-23 TaxID=1973479 RepID=A0A1Z4KX77_ANAVA|nr:hypothetical protein NIES23_62510 [Trichormus variabilis NIES-23]